MRHGRVRRHPHRRAIFTICCWTVLTACGDDGSRASVLAAGAASPPLTSRMVPTSGPAGTGVAIGGSGFTPDGNTVSFGPGQIEDLGSPDGTTLLFVVPDAHNLLHARAFPPMRPGPHEVRVGNANGTSNGVVFTVTQR